MNERSPILFWLLLAATLAVNAVAIYVQWRYDGEATDVLLFALCISQLSIVCIWSSFAASKTWRTRIAPLLAVHVAALITHAVGAGTFVDMAGMFGVHVVGLLIVLWLLQRTAIGQRIGESTTPRVWQYSVATLLAAMTIVAVLITSLRHNEEFQFGGVYLAAVFASTIAIAAVTTISWCRRLAWPIKLAIALSFAGTLGILLSWWRPTVFGLYVASEFMIQVLVISLWIELGGIIPFGDSTGDDARPASTTPDPIAR